MTILQFKAAQPRRNYSEQVRLRAELVRSLEVALTLADDLRLGFVGIDICQALERLERTSEDAN